MWRCFKEFAEALGLYTGKKKIHDLTLIFTICDTLHVMAAKTRQVSSITEWVITVITVLGNGSNSVNEYNHLFVLKTVEKMCFLFLLQNGPIISRDTGRCLEVEMSKDANFGLRLVVQRCSGQKWMIRNWIKHPRHWSQRTTSVTDWAVVQDAVGSQTVDTSERSRDWWC